MKQFLTILVCFILSVIALRLLIKVVIVMINVIIYAIGEISEKREIRKFNKAIKKQENSNENK